MAYGSPDHVDDLEDYLLDIRGYRPTPPELVEEIKERYTLIGGHSPLLELTRKQGEALEKAINQSLGNQETEVIAYLGMRHWCPRIVDAVDKMVQDGIDKAIALVMAPHSSRLSTGAYFARLDEALHSQKANISIEKIEHWYDQDGLIEAFTELAKEALGKFFEDDVYVLFTAHSLPEHIIAQGDPYQDQLMVTADLIAERINLGIGRWKFCYQSAGQTQEVWLGPAIEDVIKELAQMGEKNILVVPIGFVCDHVEILYDIDVAAKNIAAQNGIRLERSQSLNITPVFINMLTQLILDRIIEVGWIESLRPEAS